MSINETYISRNKDGYPCVYDNKTHKCVSAILSTGDNVEYFKAHYGEWIGQIEPKYEDNN